LGVYTINFQSEIVGGGAKIRFFFRLYERESGGTENLIVESTPSNRIEKERENVVTSAVLTSDYVMAAGSRLVLKLYARWEENRSATVRVYYQGAVNSRFAVPTVKEILDTVYAAKLHASQHGLGGADELSLDASQIASGVLDLARIPNIDWTHISGNFPRVISDLISSAFSRSWISDFFSSPFWDNIPDKPKLYITNVVSVTSNYTASVGDVVLVDASGGAVTITLPSPSSGAVVNVKKVDSSTNAVTIDGGGANIDGQPSIQITTQYESYTLVSDGTNWWII